MSVTNVGIKLTLDGAQQAEAGLRRVQGGMAALGNTAESVRGAMQQLAGAFAGVVSVRAFVQAADAVTTLQNQLKLATGSTQAATQAYGQLFEIAQRSRVSFTELGGTFATIARATESLGLSQQQLLGVTEAIGNAITVSGSSAAASQAALVQLGQGLAAGALRGEELNSILEQTPRLARALADGLGVSVGQLRKLGEEGKLTAEAVIAALQSQAGTLAREVQDSVVTVGQAFTQVQNSATVLVGEIDRVSGSSTTLAGALQAASDSLDNISRAFKDVNTQGQQVNVFADAIAVVFETVAVLGVNVAYVIKQIGVELGGLAAQAAAVARLDFSAAREIGRLMRDDAAAARREVDALSERILNQRRLSEQARQSLQGVDTRAEDARLARYAEQAEGVRKVGAAAADTKTKVKSLGDEFAAQREAAKAWADAYRDFARIAAGATAESLGLSQAQARLMEFLGSPAYANASEPMRQLALEQAYAAITAEQNADAQKEQTKALEAAAKAEFERIEALERNAASAEEQLQRLLDEERALVIAAERNITLAQAIEEVSIARLRERQAAMMAEGDRDAEVLAIQREIDARKKLAEAIGRKEARDAAADSAKEAAREWQRTAENIERSLTDALLRGFESGKDFARNLRDTVVNMFQTLVLRPVIQAIVAPVAGGLTSLFGLPGTANAATGEPGAFGMASSLKSIYDTVVGGFTALGNSVAFAAQDIGAWLVNNTTGVLNRLGGGLMSNSGLLGTGASYLGGIGAGIGVGRLLSGGYAISGSGNGVVNAGTAIGAFFGGPIGAAIGGAVGGLANSLFGRKLKDQGIEGTFGGDGFTGNSYKFYKGGLFRSDKTVRSALDPELDSALDQQFMALKTGALEMGQVLGASAQALNGFSKSVKISFKGLNPEQIQQKLNEEFGKLGDDMAQQVLRSAALAEMDGNILNPVIELIRKDLGVAESELEAAAQDLAIGGDGLFGAIGRSIGKFISNQKKAADEYIKQFAKDGETSSQTLSRLAGSLEIVNASFDTLGRTLLEASLKSADLASSLIEAFGSVEAYVSATNSYYQEFYSEAERLSTAQRQIDQTLKDLGITDVPKTKEEFRALVEAQDLTTEEGRKTYAALLLVAGAFADVTDAATKAAEEAAKQARATALDSLRQAIEREKRLLQLQADAASALADEVRGVFDVLTAAVRELRGEALTPIATAAQGQQTIREALVTVRAGGGLPDEDTISNAIVQARSGLGIENFGSLAEQRFEQLRLAGDLDELARYAGDQLTTAERQLLVAQQQMEALDETLVYWQDMIARTEAGIEVNRAGYESVTEAIQDLQEALKPGSTGRNGNVGTASPGISKNNVGNGIWLDGSDPNSTNDAYRRNISDLPDYQKTNWQYVSSIGQYVYIGPYSMAQEDDYRAARLIEAFYSPEADMRDTFDMLAGPQGAGSGRMLLDSLRGRVPDDILNSYEQEFLKDTPKLAVGTNYVPKDMLAFIHEGEAVVPKAYNPAAGAPQITTKRMESLIEGLTAEVQRLQMIVNDGNTYARRTAQAVNGQPEAPMLVVTA